MWTRVSFDHDKSTNSSLRRSVLDPGDKAQRSGAKSARSVTGGRRQARRRRLSLREGRCGSSAWMMERQIRRRHALLPEMMSTRFSL
ncbi:hypothetical protein ACOSP7_017968 [Xanthoceras sorbifolium]